MKTNKLKALYPDINTLDEALKVIADQDRRIGQLTRSDDYMREERYRYEQCQRKRKKEAGYEDSVSFDIVWSEILKKSRGQ